MSLPEEKTIQVHWDHKLPELLQLDEMEPFQYRSVKMDTNRNGRVFGGQLLGLSVAAAAYDVPDRIPTMLQCVFLQGAQADTPIDFSVTALQDGKRFSTRLVRATQGDRNIINASVSLQVPAAGFEHQRDMPDNIPRPESLRGTGDLHQEISKRLPPGAYTLQNRPYIDLRFVDPDAFLFQPSSRAAVQYWVRARDPLPDEPAIQSAALAYLTDYWFTVTGMTTHMPVVGAAGRIYAASLNHSVWFHAPCNVNEWLFFDCESPRAMGTRFLCVARIYNEAGSLVASAVQECMATEK